ncbi:hypothetical protein [Aestuariivirga litoralis]|uniref:hypothetical protein n=1 Tax=Aestuariivirga litoralis TaxID=2650924 RepID=UPI0018C62384|nr:hypothetical protein [Aestuariivirga litoralis]MBG1231582.1 hypothetical protein [Aestuariivirga litoralis]
MAEENEDPRERPWHPRYTTKLIGHAAEVSQFEKAFKSGKPHHAWLLCGPEGIGKATMAYQLAIKVLGGTDQARRWMESRAHPDLFVLERQLNDSKPRRLRAEISVDDARGLANFLARTASGWRVVIVDAADDLNSESANAILKLVEEPPAKTLIFLVSHQPGRLLRTLKSRCLRMIMQPLVQEQVLSIINNLPLDARPNPEELDRAVAQSGGSISQTLALLSSTGAKAFARFAGLTKPRAGELLAIAEQLGGRNVSWDEFGIFNRLLLEWTAARAKSTASPALAEAYSRLAERARIAEGFNLDRKQAAMEQLQIVNDALKAS